MAEKSTTKNSSRIIALTGAIVFLITSSALAFFVIWDLVHQPDEPADGSPDSSITDQAAGEKLQNYKPVAKIDKLREIDTKVGDGQTVKPGDTVTVLYTGAIAETGEIFESNSDGGSEPATFPLSGVIKGWGEGIPGMKIGGTRRLMIPSDLAYGPAGQPPKIPANADLVFDVTVLSIGDTSS